jgi:glutathione S-transferase
MTGRDGELRTTDELLKRYKAGEREFEQVRLSGADLHNTILHGIDLSEAILNQANLSRADLRGADLSWVDLSGADLRGADLRGAILTRADLSGANLSHANLLRADLSLANLEEANLSEAILPDGTIQGVITPLEEEEVDDTGGTVLRLYYHPVSWNARRVWIALLEKGISFELVALKLDGDQRSPQFLDINPFGQVPVLVDGEFAVFESLAILDYIEAIAPYPPLLPREPKALATVRMIEMLTVNELLPRLMPLMRHEFGETRLDPSALTGVHESLDEVLRVFEETLQGRPYFGGIALSMADIVAGTVIPWLPRLGHLLPKFPELQGWCDLLHQRQTWTQTEPTEGELAAAESHLRQLLAAT